MYQTMMKAKSILDELEIPFWLDCGTLLFMYRNNTPDKTDTDFAIHEDDRLKLLGNLDRFLKEFTLCKIWTHPKQGVVEVSIMDGDNKVDIFIKFFRGDDAFHISCLPEGEYLVGKQPSKYFDPLDHHSVDGEAYWNIPNEVENYLAMYYGDDWRTPKPNWNWTCDTPCIDKKFQI